MYIYDTELLISDYYYIPQWSMDSRTLAEVLIMDIVGTNIVLKPNHKYCFNGRLNLAHYNTRLSNDRQYSIYLQKHSQDGLNPPLWNEIVGTRTLLNDPKTVDFYGAFSFNLYDHSDNELPYHYRLFIECSVPDVIQTPFITELSRLPKDQQNTNVTHNPVELTIFTMD